MQSYEERKAESWFEHLRIFIRDAGDANKYLSLEHQDELPTFLRNLGSNVSLTGQTVRLEAAPGWAELRETARFSGWLGWRYSNCHSALQRNSKTLPRTHQDTAASVGAHRAKAENNGRSRKGTGDE
ncbi:TPA: hypothetical protein DE059_03580 [Candidatus Peribacteria bacterium]|nr:hypothetical protein [Candidatus Peribacteria bacterium]